jgi:hypothetical protein
MTEPVDLDRVERRLQTTPGFLAFELRRYHDLTRVDPGDEFNLPRAALPALGICRRPRREHYARDIDAIAVRVGLPAVAVANLLRSVDALSALQHRPASAAPAQHERTGLLMAARDRTEEHTDLDDISAQATLPGWLDRAVERFWTESAPPTAFPRDLHLPILLNLPLAVIEIDGLSVANLEDWLHRHRLPELAAVADRPLRGCLTAYAGVGVVFVDRSDSEDERRLTLAHEAGHFITDYLMPRETVIARRPDLLDVLDGERPPTDTDQFSALLSDVPIGFHAHLLERDPHGAHLSSVTTGVEDRAERIALELLAPLRDVLAHHSTASVHDLAGLLRDHFGLPPGAATRYATHISAARPGPPRTLFDAIGLTPAEPPDPADNPDE